MPQWYKNKILRSKMRDKYSMVDCGLSNILINTKKWTRVNDKFNPEIKSGNICLLFLSFNMLKIEGLKSLKR